MVLTYQKLKLFKFSGNNNFDQPFKKSIKGVLDEKEGQLSVDWADTFGTLSSKQDNTNPDDYKM